MKELRDRLFALVATLDLPPEEKKELHDNALALISKAKDIGFREATRAAFAD